MRQIVINYDLLQARTAQRDTCQRLTSRLFRQGLRKDSIIWYYRQQKDSLTARLTAAQVSYECALVRETTWRDKAARRGRQRNRLVVVLVVIVTFILL